jgi:hypothetical protein
MADPLPLRGRRTLSAVTAHVRMASDPLELIPTARDAVSAHVEVLREDGLIGAEDLRQLRASGYA